AALCISGGGIRSASFALGVIQGLARLGKNAADSVLNKVDYISTVSGGGYVGSWLSGWATREGSLEAVIAKLRKKPTDKLRPEPNEVHHLREYSNYLTPKLGLLSADTWAFFGAYFRNLLLMWLVLIPFFVGFLALPRLFVSVAMTDLGTRYQFFQVVTVVLFYWALVFIGLTRPTRKPTPKKWFYGNTAFQVLCLLPLLLFAVAIVVGRSQHAVDKWLDGQWKMIGLAVVGAVLSSLIYTIRKLRDPDEPAGVWKKQAVELLVAALGGVVFGVLLYQFLIHFPLLKDHAMAQPGTFDWVNGNAPLLSSSIAARYIVFAVPLVILALLLQATLFVGGTGLFNDDFDREWWGRAAAWVIISGIGWIVITGVVIYGPVGLYYAPRTLGTLGGISGLLAVGAGSSSKTSANEKQKPKESTGGMLSNLLLAFAAPIFVLVLLAAVSLGTTVALRAYLGINPTADDEKNVAFLKTTSWTFEQKQLEPKVAPPDLAKLGTGEQKLKTIEHPAIEGDKLSGLYHLLVMEKTPLATAAVLVLGSLLLALLMSRIIGVNRFSIHALYRDRITRGYLAASNKDRRPNPFTGFDPKDNILIKTLLKRPMHVVNMCLNVSTGENLGWQERKGASFTASPLHCGSVALGTEGAYRPSSEYGGPEGMKLGTAVGISGAAFSSNMGYHSSSPVALILTLFNVRLGWWLGNPNTDSTYYLDNPRTSLRVLLAEALGFTTKDHPYVYLSDGGHFDNLGLYEMVLRRCRRIIVSDAGADDKFVFDDLGMAIRKIFIDFGIRVVVDSQGLFPRSVGKAERDNPKYCAVGRILYSEVDKDATDGEFVYFKPVFYGDEPRDIYNYASTNEEFPHQSTLDQFFSESQLESYRGLGEYAVNQVCGIKGTSAEQEAARQRINTIAEFIEEAQKYTAPPPPPPPPTSEIVRSWIRRLTLSLTRRK
ncbi:MAG TPA: patatin-like phospholipase family protein, partial [Thermoanaerobaculia bacterium]|nr:patatin-like phospholipase family protein [Thermoanaerobaculia bacterium]